MKRILIFLLLIQLIGCAKPSPSIIKDPNSAEGSDQGGLQGQETQNGNFTHIENGNEILKIAITEVVSYLKHLPLDEYKNALDSIGLTKEALPNRFSTMSWSEFREWLANVISYTKIYPTPQIPKGIRLLNYNKKEEFIYIQYDFYQQYGANYNDQEKLLKIHEIKGHLIHEAAHLLDLDDQNARALANFLVKPLNMGGNFSTLKGSMLEIHPAQLAESEAISIINNNIWEMARVFRKIVAMNVREQLKGTGLRVYLLEDNDTEIQRVLKSEECYNNDENKVSCLINGYRKRKVTENFLLSLAVKKRAPVDTSETWINLNVFLEFEIRSSYEIRLNQKGRPTYLVDLQVISRQEHSDQNIFYIDKNTDDEIKRLLLPLNLTEESQKKFTFKYNPDNLRERNVIKDSKARAFHRSFEVLSNEASIQGLQPSRIQHQSIGYMNWLVARNKIDFLTIPLLLKKDTLDPPTQSSDMYSKPKTASIGLQCGNWENSSKLGYDDEFTVNPCFDVDNLFAVFLMSNQFSRAQSIFGDINFNDNIIENVELCSFRVTFVKPEGSYVKNIVTQEHQENRQDALNSIHDSTMITSKEKETLKKAGVQYYTRMDLMVTDCSDKYESLSSSYVFVRDDMSFLTAFDASNQNDRDVWELFDKFSKLQNFIGFDLFLPIKSE
ncbi:MAG: hypothetical protein KDD50_08915 [Bdellovibrionales bacterium]|nr:hypothetical protein [Bdellovibrionales bacterium]